jgi:hypothetical protein
VLVVQRAQVIAQRRHPADVAATATFLASPDDAGQDLHVNGGTYPGP